MIDTPTSPPQKREFFRVDAELFVKCWLPEDKDPESESYMGKTVDLSGCGLRFQISSSLKQGEQIKLEIAMPNSSDLPIECVGKVVRIVKEGRNKQEVAVDLIEIEDEAQDKLVAFCLAEQRKKLRLKVQVASKD